MTGERVIFMRKRMSNIQKTARSRPGRTHAQSAMPFGRILASGTIIVLLSLVCIWVPMAWADAGAMSDQYPGYEQAVGPDVENVADPGIAADSGSPLTADMPAADTAAVSSTTPSDATAGSTSTGNTTSDQANSGNTASSSPVGSTSPAGGGGIVSGSDDTGDDCEDCDEGIKPPEADEYSLSLECKYGDPGVYWANWDDYVAGLLSVGYKLTNNGPGTAHNLHVETATATNGVTLASILPDLGCLQAGEYTIFTLKWQIPGGVKNFTTELTICSGCNEDSDDEDDDSDDEDEDSDDDDDGKDEDDGDDSDDESEDDDSDDDDSDDDSDDEGKDDEDDDDSDDDPGLVDDNTSDDPTVTGSGSQSSTLGTSFSLTAAVERGSLPMTGLSLITAILIALGAVTPLGLIFMPIGKLIRVRRK